MAQAGSFVAGAQRQAADRRSHLRARRRVRQHRARPVDLHGRDAGDRQHPALRHVAQPGHPRRDRPRHRDLRRPQPGVGGGRAPGVEPDARGRRRSSRRTITSSPTSPTRCPSVANFHVVVREWKDDIVFLRKVVAGPIRSQLRHPGGAARRAAAGGRRARARDPERPRARRAVARRPAVAERRRRRSNRQLGLFQAPAPSDDPVRGRLRALDVDNLTPLQALTLLAELKREAGE